MSLEGVAERMSALLRERPQTFYELLRHLDDVEYRYHRGGASQDQELQRYLQ